MSSSEEIILDCPHCPKHKSPKLYINPTLELFNCFRCGFKGRISKLKDYPELLSKIEDSILLSKIKKLSNVRKDKNIRYDILEKLNPVSSIIYSDDQYSYLLNRGWNEDMIMTYNPLKSENPLFEDRVILPIYDSESNLIYFTARSIKDNVKNKYINAGVPKNNILFFSDIEESILYKDICIICEGIFDAAKLPNAISLLGKKINEGQKTILFNKLKQYKYIYICLDDGAEQEMTDICKLLSGWFPSKNIYYINSLKYNKKDLGDLSKVNSPIELLNFIQNNSNKYITPTLLDNLKSKFLISSNL